MASIKPIWVKTGFWIIHIWIIKGQTKYVQFKYTGYQALHKIKNFIEQLTETKQELSSSTLALLIEVIICTPETLGSRQKQYTYVHTHTYPDLVLSLRKET